MDLAGPLHPPRCSATRADVVPWRNSRVRSKQLSSNIGCRSVDRHNAFTSFSVGRKLPVSARLTLDWVNLKRRTLPRRTGRLALGVAQRGRQRIRIVHVVSC